MIDGLLCRPTGVTCMVEPISQIFMHGSVIPAQAGIQARFRHSRASRNPGTVPSFPRKRESSGFQAV
jgi:hypothetical protein